MKANIGLSAKQRDGVVALLNATLADEYVLYTKTRNYHWNVTGPHFNDLHKFFESQYEALDGKIDEIAEFVRYTGEKVPASLGAFQRRSPEGRHRPIAQCRQDDRESPRRSRSPDPQSSRRYRDRRRQAEGR